MEELDILIVGAGLSGLACGYKIKQHTKNLKIRILEAKDRVGGRLLSTSLKAKNGQDIWDLGGQWVGSTQYDVMGLLQELGIEVYNQYTDGKKFMELGAKNKITNYSSVIPRLPFWSLIELNSFQNKVNELQKEVSVLDPTETENFAYYNSTTAETFVKQHIQTKDAYDAIVAAVRVIFGAELSQISMLYFLSYADAAGSFDQIIEATERSGQEFRIKGGAQQICKRLAETIGQDLVTLNAPVEAGNDKVRIRIKGQANQITAKHVIFAIPPHLIDKIHFDPVLPVEKRLFCSKSDVGYMIKFIVTYKEAFWRNKGYSGEIVSNGGIWNVGEKEKSVGPLSIVYDATTANENPALVGFIASEQGVVWSQLPDNERRTAVVNSLAKFFGPEATNYLDYVEKNWSTEPYNGGCPVTFFNTGSMQYFISGLRKPFARLHFAGTESATRWCGFMNGAVQSGYRAALEILQCYSPLAIPISRAELESLGCYGFEKKPVMIKKRKIVKKLFYGSTILLIGLSAGYMFMKWRKH